MLEYVHNERWFSRVNNRRRPALPSGNVQCSVHEGSRFQLVGAGNLLLSAFLIPPDHSCLPNSREWTSGKMDIEQLISKIFEKSPLWDKKNKLHAKRNVVDKLWGEISKELDCEGKNVFIYLVVFTL